MIESALSISDLESGQRSIMALLNALHFVMRRDGEAAPPSDREWNPESPTVCELLSLLTAPQNREALRGWYRHTPSSAMNPSARSMKETLSATIGERL